jgi:nucleoside-diphosphate-sugar epimerase
MKILITGASGFVGSWLCRILALDHEVTALLRVESPTFKLEGITNLNVIHSSELDWARYIQNSQPEVLILADWWGVENLYRNDERQFQNVERFKTLVAASLGNGVRHIIGIGSQAELGPVHNQVYEDQPDNPTTSYGRAKVEARKYLLGVNSEGVKTTWFRIFSTYGPLDSGNWLIPNTVKSLRNQKSMDLTEGAQKWSYLYITDLADALLVCIQNRLSGIINCGNPEPVVIKEVVLKIAALMGKEDLLNFGAIPYRSDQVMLMLPVCETLSSMGWHPRVDINEGLYQVVEWLSGRETEYLKREKIPLFNRENAE